MKHSPFLAVLIILFFTAICLGSEKDPFEVTYITKNQEIYPAKQAMLRNDRAWSSFSKKYADWWVQFDEMNCMPHRAFGTPVSAPGSNANEVALNFLLSELRPFTANCMLHPTAVTSSPKYLQANYLQLHNGLEVLFSRATVKMTHDLKISMFGLDIYNDISIAMQPVLSAADGINAATADFPGSVCQATQPVLKILPVPAEEKYDYRLVYELEVSFSGNEMPVRYYTLVDATNGKIVYRSNRVHDMHPGGSVANITGTVYPTNPYNATSVVPMQYVKVNNSIHADVNGTVSLPSGSTNASFALEGLYARVYTSQSGFTVQSFSNPISPGVNSISFDPHAGLPHRTAYYHTNIIHDFMKTLLPSFTSLDAPMTVRVERTDGTCNAFYDGGINFYTTAGGCHALSLVADVVYHEYGHGINYDFYSSQGSTFQNPAMGEGYADVWAFSVTGNPVLGIGYDDADPSVYIRSYDFENGAIRKVYPQHLSGEEHADGEIIAGAWWDVSTNLSSLSAMSTLFAETLFGLATGPDGNEGVVYTDVLIDALFADDNDANLLNGTPNGQAIYDAFALHGITLVSTSSLAHTAIETAATNTGIAIDAVLTQVNASFAWAFSGVKVFYALNNSSTWNSVALTSVNGIDYSGSIPGQPAGTIIKYFLAVEDINGKLSGVLPPGAEAASNPNIPYFISVGYDWLMTDDFDATLGSWQAGLPGDNATTGVWDLLSPVESEVNGSVVQPGYQVTPGGSLCFVTGNATLGSNAGTNDVDGGRTTLELQGIDLSSYINPAIEYYRWYTNDQGATAGTDYWQVLISEDAGVTWIPVENTRTADHSWRRYIFRVGDYISSLSNVYMQFVAEDANAGSLIEALVDDFSVYEQGAVGVDEVSAFTIKLFPNPAGDRLYVNAGTAVIDRLQVLNALGEVVLEKQDSFSGSTDISALSEGIYVVKIWSGHNASARKIAIRR